MGRYIFFGEKMSNLTLLIKFSTNHVRIIKITGKKRTLHNKERADEVETAFTFSGSDTKREKNADITEVDEIYCTINDRIVQACNFDYRSDQESEAVKQNYRKETEQNNKDAEKKQGNTHIPFSCPSETVSAPALKTQVVSTVELHRS